MPSIGSGRLRLVALTLRQLELCLTDLPALEDELGCPVSRDVFDENVRRALKMKMVKMSGVEAARHDWFTYWLVILRENDAGVGLAGFKGGPDAGGSVEIGYGISPQYRGRGLMGEAVRALVDWAFGHPECRSVTATHVTKSASRRLLEKLGARPVRQDAESSSWKIDKG